MNYSVNTMLMLSELANAIPLLGTNHLKNPYYETPNGVKFNGVTIFGKVEKKFEGEKSDGVPSLSLVDEYGSNNVKAKPYKTETLIIDKIKKILPGDVVEIHGSYAEGEKDGRKWKNVTIKSIKIISIDRLSAYRDLWYIKIMKQRNVAISTTSYAYDVAKKHSLPIYESDESFSLVKSSEKEKEPKAVDIEKKKKEKEPKAVDIEKKKEEKPIKKEEKVLSKDDGNNLDDKIITLIKNKHMSADDIAKEIGCESSIITKALLKLRSTYSDNFKFDFKDNKTTFWFKE